MRALLAALIIFDLLVVLQARRDDWPVILSGQSLGDGSTQISVNRITFTAADWLVAALLVSVQGLVIYGNWRIGRRVGR